MYVTGLELSGWRDRWIAVLISISLVVALVVEESLSQGCVVWNIGDVEDLVCLIV